MSEADFEAAAAMVKGFTQRPTNEELLQLYAYYKQVRRDNISLPIHRVVPYICSRSSK